MTLNVVNGATVSLVEAGGVVVELAIFPLGRGPTFPAIGLVEDVSVLLPLKLCLSSFVLL
jgi:hypothetical protein